MQRRLRATRSAWRGFRRLGVTSAAAALGLVGAVLAIGPATAAATPSTYYVSTTGSNSNSGMSDSSAFGTIQYAVAHVPSGSTILVEPGTYQLAATGGPVAIEQDITLESDAMQGGSASNTILDATNLPNGLIIAGPGSAGTIVMGLTIEDAQKAGLVAISTTRLNIDGNIVTNNDQSCAGFTQCSNPGSNNGIPFGVPGSNVPPGVTPFTPTNGVPCGNGLAGGSDCEALHLMGVTNSVVRGNTVETNLDGGIYLTDEAGPTTGNLIVDNQVISNQVDCGITLASHVPGHGVSYNTVTGNISEGNGAAGIIMATPVPGGIVTHNVVSHNVVENNGQGGIDIHTHVAGSMVSHNVIVANMVSANAPDFGVSMNPATGAPEAVGISVGAVGSPITYTVVAGNVIANEYYGVYVTTAAQHTVVAGNRNAGSVAVLVQGARL